MKIAVFLDADNTMYSLKADKAYKAMFKFLSEELGYEHSLVQRVWREHLNNVLLDERKRKNPCFRKRDYILHLTIGQLGVEDEEKRKEMIEEALKIFWGRVSENIKRKKGLKVFLQFCKENRIDVFIFTDEFYEYLNIKMSKILGEDWKKWFKDIITPEKTNIMKPDKKHYELMLNLCKDHDKIFVVGDSWQRDLEMAKKMDGKFVTILINDEFSGNPDFFARDFYDVKSFISNYL